MTKPKYTQQLTKALESFVDASEKVANVALNFELHPEDVKYAQELTRTRTQDLKKQLEHKPVKVAIQLPSDKEEELNSSAKEQKHGSHLGKDSGYHSTVSDNQL